MARVPFPTHAVVYLGQNNNRPGAMLSEAGRTKFLLPSGGGKNQPTGPGAGLAVTHNY